MELSDRTDLCTLWKEMLKITRKCDQKTWAFPIFNKISQSCGKMKRDYVEIDVIKEKYIDMQYVFNSHSKPVTSASSAHNLD